MFISIYDECGKIHDKINIKDDIEYVNGRVYKGKKHYYKGIGIDYSGHYLLDYDENYRFIESTDIFYLGDLVSKKCFEKKHGIFKEKYQPHLSDYIGTCGAKELSLIENTLEFEKSSVEIINCVKIDSLDNQYYFELIYHCNRKQFNNNSDIFLLWDLLEYMIENNWNFPWDKCSITDITYDSRVSDVADIFSSSRLEDKFGTIYSVLYSLCHYNYEKYEDFLKVKNLNHKHHSDFIFNTAKILEIFNINIDSLLKHKNKQQNYIYNVYNILFEGKNCADCVLPDYGNFVRQQYKKNLINKFG